MGRSFCACVFSAAITKKETIMMTKTEELLAYLDRLIALQTSGHLVRDEIAEAIDAIRYELIFEIN